MLEIRYDHRMKPDLKRGKDPERLITTLGWHSRGLRLVKDEQ